MSDTGTPAPPPVLPETPPPSRPQRSGCLTAFMILAGVVMLLPGLCALIFGAMALTDSNWADFMPLVMLGLLIGFGGVMLIWVAVRKPSRPSP
jgi:uncharacterized membrane protein HdeD (DUF308 family)